MVELVRAGVGMREVGRTFRVSLSVVQRWVERAGGERLDRVDWTSKPTRADRAPNRTGFEFETTILSVRSNLAKFSDLGEHGAAAIHRAIVERGGIAPPSIRTIGRILKRSGVLDIQARVRRTAPPLGWYLPEVAAERVELDSFDTVSGLLLEGGIEITVLNGISLHGGLVTSWPQYAITAKLTASLLLEH